MSALDKLAGFLSGGEAGKALYQAQIVRPPEPSFMGGDSAVQVFQQKEAASHLKAYGGGKDGIDWFYDAANVGARQAGNAPFHLATPDGTKYVLRKGVKDPAEVKPISELDDTLDTLLRYPNPYMTWRELMWLLYVDLAAVGNGYWIKWGADDFGNKPSGLYRMAPPFVEVVQGKKRLVDHYVYGIDGRSIKVPPEQVVHFRLPNPHSPHGILGMGAVQGGPQAYDVELGLMTALRSYFDNGTVISGAVESDRAIPKPSRRQIVREFRNLHQGANKWHNVAFLERGLKYRPLNHNAQEAQYSELSKLGRDRIFGMLHTPRKLAGLDDEFTELDDARRFFAEDVMRPWLNAAAEIFTWKIFGAWGVQFEFDYGYQLPEKDRIAIASSFSELPGITVREAREKAGLSPLGPDVVDEEGFPVDDMVINMPGPSTEGPAGVPEARNGADPANTERFQTASPNAGNRTGDRINGQPASSADRARRARQGVIRVRRRTPGAKAMGITPEQLATLPVQFFTADKMAAARAATEEDDG